MPPSDPGSLPSPRPRPKRQWKRLLYAGIFILAVCALRSAVADWNDVLSGSMQPTIVPGDRLLVNKVAYHLRLPFTDLVLLRFSEPERGDIIVFDPPEKIGGDRMVKRVVGVPGDTISLRKNRLVINGYAAGYEPMDKDVKIPPGAGGFRRYAAYETIPGRRHPILLTPNNPGPSFYPLTLNKGEYFVLGDNRDNSTDSRFFGPVPLERVVGRVSHVVMSLDHENAFKPRPDRWWHELP